MQYFLDTNALSHLLQGQVTITARMRAARAQGDAIGTTTVSVGEVQYGIERLPESRRRHDLERKFARFRREMPCWALPPEVGDVYGSLRAQQERIGFRLADNDLWIASAARFYDTTLVSHDRDFRRINGLRIEDWLM